jgi:hypothetical protein
MKGRLLGTGHLHPAHRSGAHGITTLFRLVGVGASRIMRMLMVRDIVANDVATEFDSRCPLHTTPRPVDGRSPSKRTTKVRIFPRAPIPIPCGVPLRAPGISNLTEEQFCLGGGHSRTSYVQHQEFESPRGSHLCPCGGTEYAGALKTPTPVGSTPTLGTISLWWNGRHLRFKPGRRKACEFDSRWGDHL